MKYDSEKNGIARFVGELEADLLEILWQRSGLSAKDVLLQLRIKKKLAATTIHTVLSRLEKKGIVTSVNNGVVSHWSVLQTRSEFIRERINEITESLETEFTDEFRSSRKTKKSVTKKHAK